MARPRIEIDHAQVTRLAQCGFSINLAANILQISESSLRRWLKRHPETDTIWRQAHVNIRSRLLAEAIQRATRGGSDRMLCVLLEKMVFGAARVEISGLNGEPIQHDHTTKANTEFFAAASKLMNKIQEETRNR